MLSYHIINDIIFFSYFSLYYMSTNSICHTLFRDAPGWFFYIKDGICMSCILVYILFSDVITLKSFITRSICGNKNMQPDPLITDTLFYGNRRLEHRNNYIGTMRMIVLGVSSVTSVESVNRCKNGFRVVINHNIKKLVNTGHIVKLRKYWFWKQYKVVWVQTINGQTNIGLCNIY